VKLLLDIGNSRIKWATVTGGVVEVGGDVLLGEDPAATVAGLLAAVPVVPAEIRVANVAGVLWSAATEQTVRERWDLPVCFAASQAVAGGIANGYDDAQQLGIDRWLAILAAAVGRDAAVCVVDAGTAVTVDLVAGDGRHLGGYILPGVDLMFSALGRGTGNLERLAGRGSSRAADSSDPGHDTFDAMRGGALAAICALIERCVAQLAKDNAEAVLVMTGGDAPLLMTQLTAAVEYRPQLVLEGLAIYEPGG
jgi:type III pantothenate kinase